MKKALNTQILTTENSGFSKKGLLKPILLSLSLGLSLFSYSQPIRYTGETLSNVDYHHGQLKPALGVHNTQVFRANREYPEKAEGFGWTYNHAPMLAYWNGSFYLSYLSDPVGEHIPPSQTFLQTSADGRNWSKPSVLFPIYKIPDGTRKEGRPEVAKDLTAVMHQRIGFYVSKKSNRLLALGYYGIAMDPRDSPNDGKGVGRVVREIYDDGRLGPMHFIRYNTGWNEKNTHYPFYTRSRDKGFVQACNELLADPLMMMQWVEEADRHDPLIPLKKEYKAFSYYHLPDGRVVGLWKHALTAMSTDGGKTWPQDAVRAPGFVNSNAKIWGQRTLDDRYVTVYNPSEFRWPLALSVSNDGIDYKNLLLINGEITSMRYGGNYKSYGPQYVRGILPGNGTPPDGNLWVTYSMNKEDMWVSKIPVPIKDKADKSVNEVFELMPAGQELDFWNIYSPLWAPVGMEKMEDGSKALAMKDWDPFDYARAERLFPQTKKGSVEFSVVPAQNDKGILHIELQDARGTAALRLIFDSDNLIKTKNGYRLSSIGNYQANEIYDVRVDFDAATRIYTVNVNGREYRRIFFAPVHSLERIVFRTGEVRRFPDADTPTDQNYDLPHGGETEPKVEFYIKSLKTDGTSL